MAAAVVVLLPFLTCLPPMMKSEAMEMSTVARSPRASTTSMRLKPSCSRRSRARSAPVRLEKLLMIVLPALTASPWSWWW